MTLKEELEHILYLVSEARKGNDITSNYLEAIKDGMCSGAALSEVARGNLDCRDETESTRNDLDRAMKRLAALIDAKLETEEDHNLLFSTDTLDLVK